MRTSKGGYRRTRRTRIWRRALLNLAIPLVTALKKASHFEVHHGYAVAIGMVLMAQGAVKHGELDIEALDKLKPSSKPIIYQLQRL